MSLTPERQAQIDELLQRLQVPQPEFPESYELYHHALTHSSYTYELKLDASGNYERLEFLGDSVLKLVISEYLFDRFPYYREGELTKIRSVIVSDAIIAKFALAMQLGDYMLFGPSELRNGGKKKPSNLACAFEALMGALFLDGKIDAIRGFVYNELADEVTAIDLNPTKDNFKAVLQEYTQAKNQGLPEYITLEEYGPPHKRNFVIDVQIQGQSLGQGKGRSKKEAQQSAAKAALEGLNLLESFG